MDALQLKAGSLGHPVADFPTNSEPHFRELDQMREWLRRGTSPRSVRLWIYRVPYGQTRSNDMIAIAARQPSPARVAD